MVIEAIVERGTKPGPASFHALLFARVDEQDLASCTPEDLHRLGEAAYFHQEKMRPHRKAEITLFDEAVSGVGHRQEITVLEVINDNMPFLLDSTLAELTEQGFKPLLVAHPILAVERDAEGRLQRVAADAPGQLPAGLRRESFLHIHLDRIDSDAMRARLTEGLATVYRDVAVAVG